MTDSAAASLQQAIGKVQARTQRLDLSSLERFAAATGTEAGLETPLAHWAWFADIAPDAALGPDGHVRTGGFIPAVPGLARRMFAATTIAFHAPLILGEDATQTTRIADVRSRDGATGPLLFVDLEQLLTQDKAVRITETRTLVYRADATDAPTALPVPGADFHSSTATGELWQPDPIALFRFSAATFNSHRIHYDLPYATAAEGYPALVVHGPLIAAKLAALAAREGPLARFSFRARRPAFVDQPLRLTRTSAGDFVAQRCDGEIAALASAQVR